MLSRRRRRADTTRPKPGGHHTGRTPAGFGRTSNPSMQDSTKTVGRTATAQHTAAGFPRAPIPDRLKAAGLLVDTSHALALTLARAGDWLENTRLGTDSTEAAALGGAFQVQALLITELLGSALEAVCDGVKQ